MDEGENEVKIVYESENGQLIESAPLKFNYIPLDKPNLYVLTIGVEHNDLKYTKNDAQAISRMYARLKDERGRGFKRIKIHSLTDSSETTKLNIQKAFLHLSNDRSIKDNDLVVVFISSHGKVVNGNQYVLLPSDYDPLYDQLTSVDFEEDILRKLRNVDGNKLLFIDACHSGSAGSRSFSDASASIFMNDLIEASSGMEIFASCSDHEFSYEDDEWKNGAFTKAIVEAFENKKVTIGGKEISSDIYSEINGVKQRGQDGVITIEELKRFVEQRVPFLVKENKGKSQNPTNKSTELLPRDMGIFMVVQ